MYTQTSAQSFKMFQEDSSLFEAYMEVKQSYRIIFIFFPIYLVINVVLVKIYFLVN